MKKQIEQLQTQNEELSKPKKKKKTAAAKW